ncbi:MAG: NAD(P)H-hydrate dehydratase, partial [Pyrinomonadaceae bacterium]|nr:NAD(P)H-hydrate dehydratase [Pyrinomonadaceae bacterium]
LARLLWLRGWRTQVVLLGHLDATRGDARTNFEIVNRLSGSASSLNRSASVLRFNECATLADWEELNALGSDHDVIVDALFGTGLNRALEGLFAHVIENINSICETRNAANQSTPLILSIDLPSGLDADKAHIIGASVQADLTVTFTAPKPANVLAPASRFGGKLVVAAVGSPASLVEAAASQLFLIERKDAVEWLRETRYRPGSYKNTHGHALVIAGSRGMTGAALLCSAAAMRAGAGLVTLAAPTSALRDITARAMPEIMTDGLLETDYGTVSAQAIEQATKLQERASVVAIGPGLGSPSSEDVRSFVLSIVKQRRTPVVIDADALNALAPWPNDLRGSATHPLILTPHEGEMRRLLGNEDESKALTTDRVCAARDFATKHELILVLKGERTLVAAPDGRVFVNPTGNAGLGTAGAGDTLTGIITSFLAQTYGLLGGEADSLSAVLAAVYVGGMAGDICARERGMRTMLASDIRESLSDAIRQLDPSGEAP